MGKSVNKSELAEIFGVSERTLTEWQNDGDLPIKTKGARGQANEYDTEVVITWYVQRELNKVGVEGVRDRLARLQADEVEMRIAEKRGLLIPVEQIEPAWTALVVSAKTYLRSEPDRLAHLLETMEGVDAKRDMLADTFDEFLTKLSKFDPDDVAAAAASAASAAASGVRQTGAATEDFSR
jgi:phage terminase Nu1 subunit (DNA packaging protein)